ncbi:DUF1800 domain-containing protein [Arachidicoccus sp.]|uniref:DUF1800 domain-containing protein n=1 Tax=Arachidicoccus sp. TaxID=1872624 RepID=UPI003D1D7551
MGISKERLQHLSWRAGFGQIESSEEPNLRKLIRSLIHQNCSKIDTIVTAQSREILQNDYTYRQIKADAALKKDIAKTNREGIKNLNILWLQEMFKTDKPLREKMSLFWHGHFACRVQNISHQEKLLQIIRENALGNFGDLLSAVSKSASMLQFLNNQQNKKQHANENFGREVMELFTMGRGNYTEKDVKEGSRAFTGWAFDKNGDFIFRQKVHDDGKKTFLGKTGNFDGDDILKMLLEHKATAHHITEKIYKFVVNDTPDENIIAPLAEKFYQSNYHIGNLLENIFCSDWFYDKKNIGARIKSPIELIVGMERTIPATFANDNALLLFQRTLGQVLFYPPNVAGWPGGKDWIDSSTLLFRMRLPQIMYASEEFNIRPKAMPEEMDNSYTSGNIHDDLQKTYMVRNYKNKVRSTPDWDPFLKRFANESVDQLPKVVADTLLVNLPQTVNNSLLEKYAVAYNHPTEIKKMAVNLMCTPEYQLC